VTWTLDVGPAIELKHRIRAIAFWTGFTIYFEGIVGLALLTERQLHVAAAIGMIPILIAQFRIVGRPARQFLDGRLGRSLRAHLALALVVLALLALGTAPGMARQGALLLGVLVMAGPFGLALRASRAATRLWRKVPPVADTRVLETCLSFEPTLWLTVRWRAFAGQPIRWATPLAVAVLTFAATAAGLALALWTTGLEGFGTPVVQASTLVAVWTFYRTVRHAKPRAAALREHDRRPPVLILRQFDDDLLGTGWANPATFEHHIVNDLHRLGPTISIGEPGQRLQPLGAAREYLTGDDWKQAVGRLIDQAGLIVVIVGSSESLVWELQEVMARGGKARLVILAPTAPSPIQVARRWAAFVAATSRLFGNALPRVLPEGRLLALIFAGEDVVMVTSRARKRSRSFVLAQSLPEYRLWLRLRENLRAEDASSIQALAAFCRRSFPVVELEPQ
jgi:hypothetical protein